MAVTPWDYLMNGSLVRAAYETYNQPFSYAGTIGLPIGILFIVFQILLYIKVRNIAFHFVISLILFGALFGLLPSIMKGIIIIILILELTGIIYEWVVKEQ